jgi:hypothetical protein
VLKTERVLIPGVMTVKEGREELKEGRKLRKGGN